MRGLAVVIMIARRLYREFPIFFAYMLFEIVQLVVQTVVRVPPESPHYIRYYWTYWIFQGIAAAIYFAVIYEIFSLTFRPYEAIRELGVMLFRWSAVVLMLVAVLVAGAASGHADHITKTILLVDRSVSLVQCGLLLFLFLFASYFGLTWRSQVFGIALGFAMIAGVELGIAALRMEFGSRAHVLWEFARRGTYDLALLVWIRYLLSAEPVRVTVRAVPQNDLEKWNRALLGLLHQ